MILFAMPTANISIMPQLTPINSFSARFDKFTRSIISISVALSISDKAKAVAISMEADEESPALLGISPE